MTHIAGVLKIRSQMRKIRDPAVRIYHNSNMPLIIDAMDSPLGDIFCPGMA